MHLIKKLQKCNSAATAIEYGLIAALVAIAIIGGVRATGHKVSAITDTVSSGLGANDVVERVLDVKLPSDENL